MFRQTKVQTQNGSVLVSTIRSPSLGRDFETMVFPLRSDGHINPGSVLYEEHDDKPKNARRTHRIACQQFDLENRQYTFLDGHYHPVL